MFHKFEVPVQTRVLWALEWYIFYYLTPVTLIGPSRELPKNAPVSAALVVNIVERDLKKKDTPIVTALCFVPGASPTSSTAQSKGDRFVFLVQDPLF